MFPSVSALQTVDGYYCWAEKQGVHFVKIVFIVFENFCKRAPVVAGGAAWDFGCHACNLFVTRIHPERDTGSEKHGIVCPAYSVHGVTGSGRRRHGSSPGCGNDLGDVKLQFMQLVHGGFDTACNNLVATRDAGARSNRNVLGGWADAALVGNQFDCRGCWQTRAFQDANYRSRSRFAEIQLDESFLTTPVEAHRATAHRKIIVARDRPPRVLASQAGHHGMIGLDLNQMDGTMHIWLGGEQGDLCQPTHAQFRQQASRLQGATRIDSGVQNLGICNRFDATAQLTGVRSRF